MLKFESEDIAELVTRLLQDASYDPTFWRRVALGMASVEPEVFVNMLCKQLNIQVNAFDYDAIFEAYMGENGKLMAIKVYRQQTNTGLKEAKEKVEELAFKNGWDMSREARNIAKE